MTVTGDAGEVSQSAGRSSDLLDSQTSLVSRSATLEDLLRSSDGGGGGGGNALLESQMLQLAQRQSEREKDLVAAQM